VVSKEEIGMVLVVGGLVWLVSKMASAGRSAVTSGSTLLDSFKGKSPGSSGSSGSSLLERIISSKKTMSSTSKGAKDWAQVVKKYTAQYGVPYSLAMGLFQVESSFNPHAVNPKSKAVGMGQLYVAAGKQMGLRIPGDNNFEAYRNNPSQSPILDERYDGEKNIKASVKYLRWLKNRPHVDNWDEAVTAYNIGTGMMRRIKAGDQEAIDAWMEHGREYTQKVRIAQRRYS